jgi:hypothetical protein
VRRDTIPTLSDWISRKFVGVPYEVDNPFCASTSASELDPSSLQYHIDR